MPVLASCPCGKQFRVPDELVGRRVKCPGCGEPVSVPAPVKAAAARKPAPAADDNPAETSTPAPIHFECACGKQLQVKAEHAGKKIRCPGCQELVAVPAAVDTKERDEDKKSRISTERAKKPARPPGEPARVDDEDEPDALDDRDEEDDRPGKKSKKKTRSSLWLWVGLTAGILVLVGGGIGAWLMFGSSGPSAELALVPADAQGFVSVRVGELWGSKFVQDIVKQLPPEAKEQLTAVEKEFNMTAGDIDRVTVVVQDGEKEVIWIVFTATKPYDRKKLLDKLGAGAKEQTHQGKAYHVKGDTALHFVDDKTLVTGPEVGIKACLDHIASPKKDGPLAGPIKEAKGKPHIVAGFALPDKLMQKARQEFQGNPMAAGFLPLLDVQSGTLALTMSDKELELELGIAYPDSSKAATAKKTLDDLKKMAESLLAAGKMGGNPDQARLLNQIEKAMKDLTINQSGSSVRVAMKGEIPGGSAIAIGLLLPAVQKVREAAAATQSQNNLHQMVIAMHDQASSFDNQCFYLKDIGRDQTGKPLLSWRVALLPFIEQDNLYKQFHLNEPWDSPHNIRLLDKMPKTYQNPTRATKPGETVYQVFTGPTTLFEKSWTLHMPGSFRRGTSQTVVFVEAASPVPWTKPDDIVLGPNPIAQLSFSGGKSMVALADGSVRSIPQTMRPQTLRTAIMAEGPPLGPDW
jgi:Protein of unknown function (DUF1559)